MNVMTWRGREHEKGVARLSITWCLALAGTGAGSGPAPRRQPPAAAPAPQRPPRPPVPITDADIKGVADARSRRTRPTGDPAGTITGTAADIPVGDAKKGLTIADVVNLVGQNQIAINFVWTLVTGFLVMFMQAGLRHRRNRTGRARRTPTTP